MERNKPKPTNPTSSTNAKMEFPFSLTYLPSSNRLPAALFIIFGSLIPYPIPIIPPFNAAL